MSDTNPAEASDSQNPWTTRESTTKNLTRLAVKQAGYNLFSDQAKKQFFDLMGNRADTATAGRIFDNVVECFKTDDPNRKDASQTQWGPYFTQYSFINIKM